MSRANLTPCLPYRPLYTVKCHNPLYETILVIGVALGMAWLDGWLVSWSTTFAQTGISQQLWDGLALNFVQTFMVPI